MSLSDWDLLKSPPEVTVTIDTTTPLVGSGSLDINNQPLLHSSSRAFAMLRLGASEPRGFTAGRVRTVIKPNASFLLNASHRGIVGVFCMINGWSTPLSFTTGTGSCYIAGFEATDTTFWGIWKFTNGLLDSSVGNAALASGDTTHTPTRGNTYAIELTWQYDLSELGGTRLILKAAEGTDYDDLTTIYDVVDDASPLSTSEGEGVVMYDDSANVNDDIRQTLYDATQILRMIV